ncbi:dephospho-CoA kinase [Petrotoga olearia]|uniref:Dephospho-CoA kinase n=2 Tax=Petrotoga olearia TaxID=156203 RepID=A0A2K1P0Q4_9BACT|nr:dephospho-CoA kinase [Petrotoga olearia]KUK15853.1 MAG: Dephospho-CoA kinase [Petrotoga mobilis]PNR96375.1 dephospho-CoA kinase [Petrotoga olearia DSM 13574]RMA76571.1 dephospho-CoA kinase [Petrotoga olearia]
MVIGITGPAGSGKSTVSKIIKKICEDKASIIDVDRLGHEVLTYFFIKEKLKEIFGEEIFDDDNNISRSKLGEIVFSNKEKLELLNQIVHPEILKKTEQILKKISNKNDIIMVDAALLFKIGLDKLCDKIIYVDAPEELRIKRLSENRGIPLEKAKNIVKSQEYINSERCDFKILNIGNFDKLYKETEKIIQNL